MPPKCFIILGVSHRVQGEPGFDGAIHDPDYATVVSEIISSNHIDFVGEEGGNHTTVAENITTSFLGAGTILMSSRKTAKSMALAIHLTVINSQARQAVSSSCYAGG